MVLYLNVHLLKPKFRVCLGTVFENSFLLSKTKNTENTLDNKKLFFYFLFLRIEIKVFSENIF